MHVALATRRGHPEINIVAQFLSHVARPLHHVSWRHCSPPPALSAGHEVSVSHPTDDSLVTVTNSSGIHVAITTR